jgi:hypothetical protein
MEMLNADLFTEFIKAFSRLRYPTNPDFCNLVLDEIKERGAPVMANRLLAYTRKMLIALSIGDLE